MSATREANEELQEALHARLIATGEWDRILEVLRRGLDESSWEVNLREKAEEKARQQDSLSLVKLVEELEGDAHSSIPPTVKAEVTAMLMDFVSRNVEDA